MPKISVIVPVYRVEPYLRRCVESILAQTFTDFELILADDGSPDYCPVICDEYALKDCRMVIIHNTNEGQATARNRGVLLSSGEWINFVDSDDFACPYMLDAFIKQAEDNTLIVVGSCIESKTFPGWEAGTVQKAVCEYQINEDTLDWLFEDPYIPWVVWSKLIKAEIIKRYPFQNGRFYEDNAVVCKWLVEAGKIKYLNRPLYFYQINDNGTTNSIISEKNLDYVWATGEQVEFLFQIGYFTLANKMILNFFDLYSFYRKVAVEKSFTSSKIIDLDKTAWKIYFKYKNKSPCVRGKSKLLIKTTLRDVYKRLLEKR